MNQPSNDSPPSHFKGKDAIGHVAEAQAKGIAAAAEIHGTEIPGHISAGTDAARETALLLSLFWIFLHYLSISFEQSILFFAIFGGGLLIWKAGRSAWLGWSRLERLHRVVAQEKWEIEHNRPQERDELTALYAAKGFEGKLLNDVIDVLMADGDRLLKVMVQEELGLSLESHEHPLEQSLGAAIGTCIAVIFCLACYYLFPPLGMIMGSALILAISAAVAAYHEGNKIVPAVVWSLGVGIVSFGFVYFLADFFKV